MPSKHTKPTPKATPLVTEEMIAQFVSAANCPVSVARNYLEANRGNAALALQYFYETQRVTKPTAQGEPTVTKEDVDELLGFAPIPRETARRLLRRVGGDIEAAAEEYWRDVSEPAKTFQGGEASGTARRTQHNEPVRPAVIRMQNPNVDNRPLRMPSESHVPSPDTRHSAEPSPCAQVTSTHISETQRLPSHDSDQSGKGKETEVPTEGKRVERQGELDPPPIDKGKKPEVRKPPTEPLAPEEPLPTGPPKTSSRSFAIFTPRQDPSRFSIPVPPPKPPPGILSEKRRLPDPLIIQKPQAKQSSSQSSSSDSSSQELPPMRNSPPRGPASSPPSTPPPTTLASPDECWNAEQREYLIANAKGGGLELIKIARRYEE